MASEIDMQDNELLELMQQLEAETGVTPAPVAAPVVAAATPSPAVAAPAAPALVAAVATPAAKPTDDNELLEALEAINEMPASKVAASAAAPLPDDELLAALEETPAAAPAAAVAAKTEQVSPDDELAALEAEIAAQSAQAAPAAQPQVLVQAAQVAIEVGAPPAAAEQVASVVKETVKDALGTAPVAAAAAEPTGKSQLQAHLESLDFFVDPNKFKVETRVSDIELERCMIEQNSLRAYYGAQAAQAEAQAARMKLRFEVAEAKLYDEHRRILLEAGEKVTEKMVEVEVKKDPRWGKLKSMVIDADTISNINRALVDSLRDRQSMLIQLSADRRDELKGQRSTMAATEQRQTDAQRAADAAKAALNR